ncbi:hypothetical protein CVT26_003863 [Gymnopilus dilepis]|uniref:Uncharacterized protein n=1 Tax=Gymnopilus dilepis TaxID=231916 RepID=A0A409YUX4_9AGAR|nr:hypothetical protein CVT26_003863 [Gymnopilus dilepis]
MKGSTHNASLGERGSVHMVGVRQQPHLEVTRRPKKGQKRVNMANNENTQTPAQPMWIPLSLAELRVMIDGLTQNGILFQKDTVPAFASRHNGVRHWYFKSHQPSLSNAFVKGPLSPRLQRANFHKKTTSCSARIEEASTMAGILASFKFDRAILILYRPEPEIGPNSFEVLEAVSQISIVVRHRPLLCPTSSDQVAMLYGRRATGEGWSKALGARLFPSDLSRTSNPSAQAVRLGCAQPPTYSQTQRLHCYFKIPDVTTTTTTTKANKSTGQRLFEPTSVLMRSAVFFSNILPCNHVYISYETCEVLGGRLFQVERGNVVQHQHKLPNQNRAYAGFTGIREEDSNPQVLVGYFVRWLGPIDRYCLASKSGSFRTGSDAAFLVGGEWGSHVASRAGFESCLD